MTSTFARILRNEEANDYPLYTFVDATIPEGHFGAVTKVGVDTAVYLVEGEKNDPDAVIKGHVLVAVKNGVRKTTGYVGGGLASGIELGPVQDYTDSFAQMV